MCRLDSDFRISNMYVLRFPEGVIQLDFARAFLVLSRFAPKLPVPLLDPFWLPLFLA